MMPTWLLQLLGVIGGGGFLLTAAGAMFELRLIRRSLERIQTEALDLRAHVSTEHQTTRDVVRDQHAVRGVR